MTEGSDRYVEVLGEGAYDESVQRLGVSIRISAETHRTESAMSEIARLRDLCIERLKAAGVSADDIREAGAGVEQQPWRGKKRSATQVIHVSTGDMAVITKAIYSVEPLVKDKRYTFNTTMHLPQFEALPGAVEAAQRRAMADARRQASVLAEEAGLILGGVLQVQQLPRTVRQQHGYQPYGSDSIGEMCAFDAEASAPPGASGIDTPQRAVRVRYRVRFAAVPNP